MTSKARGQKESDAVKEVLRNAIRKELSRARGHLVMISTRKLSIWNPELEKFAVSVRAKALKELITCEYSEYLVMEWNGKNTSDKRYILVRDPREKEIALKALNLL
jgi:hypothetical protein